MTQFELNEMESRWMKVKTDFGLLLAEISRLKELNRELAEYSIDHRLENMHLKSLLDRNGIRIPSVPVTP